MQNPKAANKRKRDEVEGEVTEQPVEEGTDPLDTLAKTPSPSRPRIPEITSRGHP